MMYVTSIKIVEMVTDITTITDMEEEVENVTTNTMKDVVGNHFN